jgi:hypothetical protein
MHTSIKKIKNSVRPFTSFFAICLALIVFSLAYYFATNADTSPFIQDTRITKKLSPYDARSISVASEGVHTLVKGSYPQFPNASAEFNDAIKNTVKKSILEHQTISEENWSAMHPGEDGTVPKSDDKFTYSVDWSAPTHTKELASVVLRHGGFSGGAHGSYAISTFTYDYTQKKTLTIADMFPAHPNFLKKLSVYARATLPEIIAEKAQIQISEVPQDMLSAGTEPTLENFKEFTLAADGSHITIYFGLYQVAAYAFGEQILDVDLPTNDNLEPAWLE